MRIDEIYQSVQGEGPRVGLPTVFIRTGGCNLRCPGWPCDTQHAIDPKFRKEWKTMTPAQVADEFKRITEGQTLVNACLTGGEPFMQQDGELEELVYLLSLQANDIECFSNGTRPYPGWAFDHINFIMDWKLPGSGEDPFNKVRLENLLNLCEDDAVKFVIKDPEDFALAEELWHTYIKLHSPVQVFYGVAWDQLTNASLVDWVTEAKLPWRLNVQMHNYIWDRRKRGI